MLFLFPDTAHAMGTQGGGDPSQTFLGLLPLILMFGIFYVLLIRPQQKRAKEHKNMLEALKRGDEVITSGGIHGKVTGITDDVATIEVAQNVRIRVQKQAIASVKKAG
ncbi:MAG: preprotein translocase subunit YajC [Deferrisomatales bacterium]